MDMSHVALSWLCNHKQVKKKKIFFTLLEEEKASGTPSAHFMKKLGSIIFAMNPTH
jgi:hypothetical protein